MEITDVRVERIEVPLDQPLGVSLDEAVIGEFRVD
jgi:hypothetical protein